MNSERNESERLFAHFCAEQGIVCEPIPRAEARRTADYRLVFPAGAAVAEVKQINPNEADERISRDLATYGHTSAMLVPGRRVRKEIKDSCEQLGVEAKGRYPALLVLYDNTGGRTGAIALHDVLVAMYGEQSVEYALDSAPDSAELPSRFKTGGNRGVDREHNRTLSAVAVLGGWAGVLSLDVYHNCYASKPLPPEWLRANQVRHFVVTPWRDGTFRDWRLHNDAAEA